MIGELFSIGPLSISPFGPMLVVAFVAAYFQLRSGMRRLGVGDEEDASAILFAGGLAGIIGGKLYYAALTGDWRTLIDRAGIVWYGSFFLGTVAVLWVLRRRRLPFWQTLDAAGPALALGYGVGRVGCFLVGDDYGRPTGLPWGIAFPEGPIPTTAGVLRREYGYDLPPELAGGDLVAVHPTQLYETLAGLAIWGLGVWLLRRRVRPGLVGLSAVALLAAERFAVELVRAKDDRFFGELTLAQAISVVLLLICLVLSWQRRRQPAPEIA